MCISWWMPMYDSGIAPLAVYSKIKYICTTADLWWMALVFNILNLFLSFFFVYMQCFIVLHWIALPPPEVNGESNFFEDASLKSTIEEKGRNRGLRDMQVMKSLKSISKLWWVQGQQHSACFTVEIDLCVSTLSEGRVKQFLGLVAFWSIAFF